MRLDKGASALVSLAALAAFHAVKPTASVMLTSVIRHHMARRKPFTIGGLVLKELGPTAAVITADSPAGLLMGIQGIRTPSQAAGSTSLRFCVNRVSRIAALNNRQ